MSLKIFHQENWSRTVEGIPIELYKSNKNAGENPNKKTFLFIGGVHGDEPEGVRLAMDLLEWLKTYQWNNNLDWILVPCLNPEGYRRNQRTNSRGVDLNRNFPTDHWKLSEKNRYYSGSAPASEIETQSLIELILNHHFNAIIHFHSWKPCIVYTGASGKNLAEVFSLENCYPVREDIGYPTPGSLGEWGWEKAKTPVICLEAQEHSRLETVWPTFQAGFIKVLTDEGLSKKGKHD